MPTEQHTHRLAAALTTAKIPSTCLAESAGRLWCDISPRCWICLTICSTRRTLSHAFVQVLHQCVANLRATVRLVYPLQDRRHFGLPYVLKDLGHCCEV